MKSIIIKLFVIVLLVVGVTGGYLSAADVDTDAAQTQINQSKTEAFTMETESNLQSVLLKAIDNKTVFGTSFCVKKGSQVWCGASGDMATNSQFYVASVTKLYVSAIIMNFRNRGLLTLDDPISKYLPPEIRKDLHIYKGKDYSDRITIRNLLAHTSGLPDYFQQKNKKGISLESDLTKGNDQHWTFEQAVERSKRLSPKFIPGTKGKANYSDTNYQLLGKIIEVISGKSFSANCEELIFTPLGLKKTYLYSDAIDTAPTTMYYKDKPLPIPLAMTSFGPDGGIVSTSWELQIFLEAFFKGAFFPVKYFTEMKQWNRIFFPMQSGIGLHMFKLPWYFNPTGAMPTLYGHSGLSGTFAYYDPKNNIYITGTVNQIASPSTSFRLAIKLILQVLKN